MALICVYVRKTNFFDKREWQAASYNICELAKVKSSADTNLGDFEGGEVCEF